MSHPHQSESSPKVRQRRGPRYQVAADVPDTVSAEFREHSRGLTNRMKGVEDMRRGRTFSPHALVRRYLMSGRGLGLGKEWGQRFAVWVQNQVDFLWPLDHTPLEAVAERALVIEGLCNVAEKRADVQECLDTIDGLMKRLEEEITIDHLHLAKLARRREELEAAR